MTTLLLFLHLAGALTTLGLLVGAVWSLLARRNTAHSGFALSLGIAALYQSATGSLLAFSAHSGTLRTFCVRIGLYLTAIILIEIVLLVQILKKNPAYSIKFISSSLAGSVALAGAAAVVIY